METKKQTAVEWLIEQYGHSIHTIQINEQAKAMEKGQIVDAHSQGIIEAMTTSYLQECDIEPMSEQYYTETYGK